MVKLPIANLVDLEAVNMSECLEIQDDVTVDR